ncbi:hypothetical protein [Formosa haliotis]|uniref:hypothetical protein n=1 Tax=Formosa haliotis TaxID=1555194 RepID=UPI0008259856|nr:hypothetical protein [Formosa haliotis]
MKRLITNEFGTLKLYEKYVFAQMNEGITITKDLNNILLQIANTYYKDSPFVYITNRKNSYSVDPAIYLETSKIKNLIGFAIVSNIPLALSNVKIERMFLDKPCETFDVISDAKQWANTLVKQHHKLKDGKPIKMASL